MAFSIVSFNANRPKSASNTSIAGLTKTFRLSPKYGFGKGLREVHEASGDPSRQRRAHRKSKDGCVECKKRRVKCNGGSPCEACIRRGERCERRIEQDQQPVASIISRSLRAAPPNNQTRDSVVNLQQLKLLHHFQIHTALTLLFPLDVWQHTLQLSCEFDFLKDAILGLSARHLAFLTPEDASYPSIAASHLCRALSGFRLELSNDLTSKHLDVFIATSSLLQFEIWTQTDFLPNGDEIRCPYNPSRDHMFEFCASLKEVFLRSFPPSQSVESSLFMPYIRDNSMDALVDTARISRATLTTFQAFFSQQRVLAVDMLAPDFPYIRDADLVPQEAWLQQVHFPTTKESTAPVVTWLCLLLSYLPESKPPIPVDADSFLMPKLARYIFSFPIMARGYFASLVQKKDAHALVLLYHFYRAARMLLPKDMVWWAHKRAFGVEVLLRETLVGECARRGCS